MAQEQGIYIPDTAITRRISNTKIEPGSVSVRVSKAWASKHKDETLVDRVILIGNIQSNYHDAWLRNLIAVRIKREVVADSGDLVLFGIRVQDIPKNIYK